MKFQLPPPLSHTPPPRSFWQDFRLLFATQIRLTWNKVRQWPLKIWLLILLPGLSFFALFVYLGELAYGALGSMTPDIAQGFLSLLFMVGLAAQMFFGITAAFATLYMSEDLELLFVSPVSTRAVFAVKTLVIAVSNLLTAVLFTFLPGVFYGLLFGAPFLYYFWALVITLALLAIGTALAELINLAVMRIVPPHRSKEAIGVIGAVAGILIALVFQIPNLVMTNGGSFNLGEWLSNQEPLLRAMGYFPWGWSALALSNGAAGQHLAALGWSLAVLALGVTVFSWVFLLVERGFRRGWISLSQGAGGRRRRTKKTAKTIQEKRNDLPVLAGQDSTLGKASPWLGMWAVAKKDLLYMKRDTREWIGYLTPLLIMVFFVGRFLFFPGEGARETLLAVLVMYTVMFSGNLALQSFGREGEADWFLNSVPLAGWPVVWGKLLATILPTLVLMEALLVGTALAIGLAPNLIIGLAVGAVFISLGSSAIGLYYSINNCRYNPDSPQQRLSPGAALVMYLINLIFIALLGICLVYIFPPAELLALVHQLPSMPWVWGFPDTLFYLLYLLSFPLKWKAAVRISFGLLITLAIWGAVFFSFMKATVKQSRKGIRVPLVTTVKKSQRYRF